MIARTEANSIFLSNSMKGISFGGIQIDNVSRQTIASRDDAVIDCLIKWVQLALDVDHSPALNRLCLRVWTQLTYLLAFSPD